MKLSGLLRATLKYNQQSFLERKKGKNIIVALSLIMRTLPKWARQSKNEKTKETQKCRCYAAERGFSWVGKKFHHQNHREAQQSNDGDV